MVDCIGQSTAKPMDSPGVVVRRWKCRTQFDHPLITRHRLIEHSLLLKQGAKIVVCLEMIGPKREELLIGEDRLSGACRLRQCYGKTKLCIRIISSIGNGSAIPRNRLGERSPFSGYVSEIIAWLRHRRLLKQGLLVRRDGLVDPAQLAQRVSQVVVSLGMNGLKFDGC